jgi:acyl-coenzyme A thioesterase PaaI-like protein
MSDVQVTVSPFEHRVVARNSGAASANKIHADEGARTMGFRAALVPGNALYCYLESAIRGSLGPDWTERGAAEVRFTAPAYDGDQLTAAARPADGGAVEVTLVRDENGQVAASARAWLRGAEEPPPPVTDYPHAALPDSPPPFSEAWALDSGELGSLDPVITAEDVAAYLAGMGERPDAFGADVPSAFLARMYARIMSANVVRTDPSIHTSSRISHYRRVELGDPISVRGHIERLFGRRGNRYYVLDMAYLNAGGEVVMSQRHTAIYRLRKRDAYS